jgi:hypothetical protein
MQLNDQQGRFTTHKPQPEAESDSNMKKETSKEQFDGATAKEGGAPQAPSRRKRSSGDNEHTKNRSSNENHPKRRCCNNPDPRPRRPLIPEARVVQEPSDCAFVSEDDDGDQRDILETLREERLLQESIKGHTRLFTPSSHPEFFVTVHRNNNFSFSDDEGEEL